MIKNKKKIRNLIIWLSVLVFSVVCLSIVYISGRSGSRISDDFTIEDAQNIVDTTFKELPASLAAGANQILSEAEFKVVDLKLGNAKDAILRCDYTVADVKKVIDLNKQQLINEAYEYSLKSKESGKSASATKIRQMLQPSLSQMLDGAKTVSGTIEIYIYEVAPSKFEVYLDDKTVDTLTGGLIYVEKAIDSMNQAVYNGETVNVVNEATLRTGIKQYFALDNYSAKKPVTGNWLTKLVDDFTYEFNRNFIEGGKWMYLISGLGMTLAITLCAGVLGMILGFFVAIIRCTHEMTGKFNIADKICGVYLTVIRGTPVMVQLLIIYFVIFLPIGVPKFLSAVLCFGLNSGAYVAEIVRGGIMSIDKGQTEAGRSLGFGYAPTMINFVMPQAFKAVLPALANEFITLLKESSVAFYIGVSDLTQGGLRIRSITFSSFMPLIAVALIYLAIVMILTKLVGILERRLRRSDH